MVPIKTLIGRNAAVLITVRAVPKKLSDCEPGELVHVTYGSGAALAITFTPFKVDDDATAYLAVLRTPDGQEPHWDTWPADRRCLSFGTNWIIEPVIEEDLRSDYMGEGQGALSIGEGGSLYLRLPAPQRGRLAGTARIDIATGLEIGTPLSPEHYGTIAKWALWLNEDQRQTPGAKPFFMMNSTLVR